VPGLDIRRVKTEVELQDGQSFAIGGLLDNRETQTLSKIPFIGDVPVLGKFFQSIDKRKTNTELIVIVTPEVVAPIPAGAPLPELKFPETFLPSASGIPMTTPTGGAAKPAAPTAMPVEKLIQSMQPEQPLNTEGGTSGYATPTSSTSGPTATTPPTQ
jgi:pilus assembly protein CpaC